MVEGSQRVLQLKRLETLFDVVYAIIVWRFFMLLPRPEGKTLELASVSDLLGTNWNSMVIVLLGIVIVIVFWIQSNTLFGNLAKTDVVHSSIAISQMFFTLFLLYTIGLGVHYGSSDDSRLLESIAALVLGIISFAGWRYAMGRGRLLVPEVGERRAQEISTRNLSEPLAAAITIPFAFTGPVVWELSWFFYPVLVYAMRRWSRRTSG